MINQKPKGTLPKHLKARGNEYVCFKDKGVKDDAHIILTYVLHKIKCIRK